MCKALSNEIQISMDGRGRFQNNIFIERLWWTLKYHYFYLRTFENGSKLRNGLKKWFQYYNQERFHQSIEDWTPDEICFMKQELKRVAWENAVASGSFLHALRAHKNSPDGAVFPIFYFF